MTAGSTASRGALTLVCTQGTYFVLGYLVVVVLARELGPAAYGVYGVIMSVLVWMEQSARRAVPSAAAKLIAERSEDLGRIRRAALILNLGLHAILFGIFWLAAPRLAGWFDIENGTFLLRLAALDLPLYGIYTALQGIYQGQRRFVRLGFSDITYALAKLVGVILIVRLGVSVEKALIVNIAASVVGILFLLVRLERRTGVGWRAHAPAILAIAAPLAMYSIANLLGSSLDVWLLKALGSVDAMTVGLYVAALNIARVPGFALSTLAQVLLPSVARAVAARDDALVRHYVNQAVRFFLIVYVPTGMVLFADPEGLMRLIYSSQYTGGGVLLALLVIAHGAWAMQAILAAVLVAAARARAVSLVMGLAAVVAVPVLVSLIRIAGAPGAAAGSGVIALVAVLAFAALLWRQFGAIVRVGSLGRIAGAALAMGLASAVSSAAGAGILLSLGAGVVAYGGALLLLAEVKADDFAALAQRAGAK